MVDFTINTFTDLCPDPVIGVDSRGVIIIFNPAAERLLGYRAADVVGSMSIVEIYGSWQRAKSIKQRIDADDVSGAGRIEGYETELLTFDGMSVPIRLSASLMVLSDGQVGSIGFFHDLTARKRLESKLKVLSITDDLTGLFNQRHFYETLESELKRARRYRRQLSLLCIDLDNFKQVNDRLGHLEGDCVLRYIGRLIKGGLRSTDQAFRYGGDEFMLLLPETGLADAQELAERLRLSFTNYSSTEQDMGFDPVTMSIGVTSTDGSESVKTLINRADTAMYHAKNSGGDRVHSGNNSQLKIVS